MAAQLIDIDATSFDISGSETYDLTNGDISTVLVGADLSGANLSGTPGANLTGVNLVDVNFTDANLAGVIFDNVSSGGIIPSGINPASVTLSPPYQLLAGNLVGPNVNLSSSSYGWYDDSGPRVGVRFESADLSQYDLKNTNFTNADLTLCAFSKVDLNRG